MNPEVKELKKRVAQAKCYQCRNFNPRENHCGLRDIYMDGRDAGCDEFLPARIMKLEKRIKQDADKEANEA